VRRMRHSAEFIGSPPPLLSAVLLHCLRGVFRCRVNCPAKSFWGSAGNKSSGYETWRMVCAPASRPERRRPRRTARGLLRPGWDVSIAEQKVVEAPPVHRNPALTVPSTKHIARRSAGHRGSAGWDGASTGPLVRRRYLSLSHWPRPPPLSSSRSSTALILYVDEFDFVPHPRSAAIHQDQCALSGPRNRRDPGVRPSRWRIPAQPAAR
jgi:hypothetical protein